MYNNLASEHKINQKYIYFPSSKRIQQPFCSRCTKWVPDTLSQRLYEISKKISTQPCRDGRKFENVEGRVVMWGQNLPHVVVIGSSELSKYWGACDPLPPRFHHPCHGVSTYHSFISFKATQRLFKVFDHAIFSAVIGPYHQFILINLHKRQASQVCRRVKRRLVFSQHIILSVLSKMSPA